MRVCARAHGDVCESCHLLCTINETCQASPGVLEVEPSMAWGPSALAGVGIVDDHKGLYEALHGYLASEGKIGSRYIPYIPLQISILACLVV